MRPKISLTENQKLFGVGLLFLFIYLVFFPTNILIRDEWNYFRQGLAYSQGHPQLLVTNPFNGAQHFEQPGFYPLGVPFFLATLITLFGKQAVFLQGLISLLGGYYFSIKILENFELDRKFALLLFMFFPAVLLSRTLMSDLPSLLFVSGAVYLCTKNTISKFDAFLAGILVGIAVVFREPNLLLTLPFLVGFYFRRKLSEFILAFVGLGIMAVIRLGSSQWAFGDYFFTKDPGFEFTWKFLLTNLLFYIPFLMLVIPAGAFAVIKYKGKFRIEIIVSLLLFVGLYLVYGYNGTSFSGMKSIFLGPRFLIPSLPLFAICIATMCQRKMKFISKLLYPIAVLSIIIFLSLGHFYNVHQREVLTDMEHNKGKIHLVSELNTLPKIFYPVSLLIEAIIERDTFMYVETALRKDTEAAKAYTTGANKLLDELLVPFQVEQIYSKTLPDRITITQYKVSK